MPPQSRPTHRARSRTLGRIFAIALLAGAAACANACSKQEKPAFQPPPNKRYWSNSPKQCGVDEVREYFCDELLPLNSALPAPEPFQNCPGSIEQHVGLHEPLPPVSLFDPSYTAYIRKRMPPGHSCCYSWCGRIQVTALDQVPPAAGCNDPLAFRESYCLDEPESGTSRPADGPFERCPVAIAPPEGAAFSVPPAAPFDPQASYQRRQQGFRQCCYTWCSNTPGGVIEKKIDRLPPRKSQPPKTR